jgi:hypothetical protein
LYARDNDEKDGQPLIVIGSKANKIPWGRIVLGDELAWEELSVGQILWGRTVFCPCRSALVGPDHHSAKKLLILTMKLWKMKKKL